MSVLNTGKPAAAKMVKTPAELGINGSGTWKQLKINIRGFKGYNKVMTIGGGPASTDYTGNKGFKVMLSKCKDIQTNRIARQSIFFDNTSNKGLVPAIGQKVDNAFHISRIWAAFKTPTQDCMPVTCDTITKYNDKGTETRFVTIDDIKGLSPCVFTNKKNPVTDKTCPEEFTNMMNDDTSNLGNIIAHAYFISLALLIIYLIKSRR